MVEKHYGMVGSQLHLQNLINKYPQMLNDELSRKLNKKMNIEWVSPLAIEGFKEYKDDDFLKKLDIKDKCDLKRPLKDFWPENGAHWDALGKTDEEVFIVEAKGHIEEIISPESGAKNPESIKKIRNALQETKDFLNVKSEYDWSKTLYQYANRLAHLYYLKECCEVNAHLIFIYFTEDKSWEDYGTEYGWKCAEIVVHKILGLPKQHKLSKYIHNVYIDVNRLRS